MLFSETFNLGDVAGEEWLDPLLSVDTELFIDPFLLYDNEQGLFVGSHAQVIDFFNAAFETIARSNGDRSSAFWRRTEDLLLFPEVEELCLGYTSDGTGGVGSGRDTARRIASALWTAIEQGITSLNHFEEVQIFEEGIGPDRISDATAGILRHRFATYTQQVCQRAGAPVTQVRYQRASFDRANMRWISGTYRLPINPYNEKPIFLVPRRYIRPLPTINPTGYWQYCFDNEAAIVAGMFGDDVTRNVDKQTIIELARAHPETRQRYVQSVENAGAEPYDFLNDPRSALKWYGAALAWVQQHPLRLTFSSPETFATFVTTMIEEFRRFVEDNRGWDLLWNENETPRRESASQRLFLGVVKHYCKANDVDISPEANIGSGPVDFKLSSGYEKRALIEVKLAKNTRFWHGLERQLPKYLRAEDVTDGRFLVVIYQERDLALLPEIRERVDRLNAGLPYRISVEIVDARRGVSASLL